MHQARKLDVVGVGGGTGGVISPKYAGTDMRLLARQQMIDTRIGTINKLIDKDLASRYEKAGLTEGARVEALARVDRANYPFAICNSEHRQDKCTWARNIRKRRSRAPSTPTRKKGATT